MKRVKLRILRYLRINNGNKYFKRVHAFWTRLNSVYRVIRDESSFLKLYFTFSIVISLFFSGARPLRALFELSFEFSWKQTCGDNEVVHTRNERAWGEKKTGRCEKCLMWRTRREQWPPIFLAKLNPVTCESW